MILYLWSGPNRLFAGTVEIEDEFAQLPGNSALQPPPETTGTEVAQWAGSGWIVLPQAPAEPEPGLPSYQDVLAELSADYNADIDALDRAFATATLIGGAAMDTKHAAIREQFNVRKTTYLADYSALRAKYGV